MSRPCKHGTVGMRSGDARNRCQCQKCTDEIKAKDVARYYARKTEKLAYAKRHFNENRDAILERNRKWRKDNAATLSEKDRAWYALNSEADNARRRAHYEENKTATRLRMDAWYRNNRDAIQARSLIFIKLRSLRTPSWFGELDELVALEAYELCGTREKATGGKWEVDHMLPLRAKTVSGLHLANNLQVIPKSMNRRKRSSIRLTEPGQWIAHMED